VACFLQPIFFGTHQEPEDRKSYRQSDLGRTPMSGLCV
jgi:hypothetical protein